MSSPNRMNIFLTDDVIRALDEIRARKQRGTLKALSRVTVIRDAIAQFIKEELEESRDGN